MVEKKEEESEGTIRQWKPSYRPNVLPEEESEEVDTRHPMEKAYRRGKL